MLWLVVCLLSLVRASESCTEELEKVLWKPVACGAAYFERLSCELQSQLAGQRPSPVLCARFRQQWQVGLEVVNPSGRYLCSNANNPTAAQYLQIFLKLNYRSAENRYSFYLNYNTTEDLPGPESPNMDSYGILAFSVYLGVRALQNVTVLPGLFDEANAHLAVLPALSSPSNQEDVANFVNIADILTHTDQYDFTYISYAIQKLLGRNDIRTYPPVASTALIFPEIAFKVLFPDNENPSTPQERIPIYSSIVNELNYLLKMSRRTFSWTFPFPISQLESTQCEYAYTYFDVFGTAYRIVLNQPLEAVMYKK